MSDLSSVFRQLEAIYDFPGAFVHVHHGMSMGERFNGIRHNYRRKQAMVDAGLSSWFRDDPYEMGDWPALFTPIESALWCDIRHYSLDLWPQFPVGRFFVDFGNPVARVAIECDGHQWHQDKEKDRARDEALRALGWSVIRIPGWQCKGEILTRSEAEEQGVGDFHQWRDEKTPYAALMRARDYLEAARESEALESRRRSRR